MKSRLSFARLGSRTQSRSSANPRPPSKPNPESAPSTTFERLVRLYETTNKPDKYAEWKQTLEAFDKGMLAGYAQGANPAGTFAMQDSSLRDFFVGAGLADRAPPPSFRDISDYARTRWRTIKTYRPKPLGGFKDQF